MKYLFLPSTQRKPKLDFMQILPQIKNAFPLIYSANWDRESDCKTLLL